MSEDYKRRDSDIGSPWLMIKLIGALVPLVVVVMSIGVLYYKVEENTSFRKRQGEVAINFVNMTNSLNIINSREIPALTQKVLMLRVELKELSEGVSELGDGADTQFLDLNYRVNSLNSKVQNVIQSYKDYLNNKRSNEQ